MCERERERERDFLLWSFYSSLVFILCFVLVEMRDECARVLPPICEKIEKIVYVTLFELRKKRDWKKGKNNSIRTRRERVTDNNNKI